MHPSIAVSAPHPYLQFAGSKILQQQRPLRRRLRVWVLGPCAGGFASRSYWNSKKLSGIVPQSSRAAAGSRDATAPPALRSNPSSIPRPRPPERGCLRAPRLSGEQNETPHCAKSGWLQAAKHVNGTKIEVDLKSEIPLLSGKGWLKKGVKYFSWVLNVKPFGKEQSLCTLHQNHQAAAIAKEEKRKFLYRQISVLICPDRALHSRLSDYGGTCRTVTGGRNTRGRAGAAEEKGERDWEQVFLRSMLEMGETLRAGGGVLGQPSARRTAHAYCLRLR